MTAPATNADFNTKLDRAKTPVVPPASTNISRLAELEAVIERGLETFIAEALTEIRDDVLYKETHGTFEEYCPQRWGIERAHAYRLIEATGVIENLSPMGDIPLPKSARVARELKPLPPEGQRQAWGRAIEQSESGRPTASEVNTVVAEIITEQTTDREMPRPIAKPIATLTRKHVRKCRTNPGMAKKEILRIVKALETYGRPVQMLIITRRDGEAVGVEIVEVVQ